MNRTRSALGIAALLAVMLCAFAATSAQGADRAYTCEKVEKGKGVFDDAHCLVKGEIKEYEHKLIPKGTVTPITATNKKTASSTTASSPAILKGHIAGVETAVTCGTVHGIGTLENGETTVSGKGTIEYTECTVTLPAGKGCKVTGGAVTTKELKATTAGTTGTRLKFEPVTAPEFATVPIEGCEKERPPKGNYVVEGSLEAPVSGATTTAGHSEITSQGKLLFGGTVAGLEGAITISMKEPSGEPGNGIVLTP